MLQAGKCQEHLGNWKHASKLYSQLVSQYPDSTMAERAEERLALIEQLAQKPASPNSSINTRPKRR